MHAITDFLNQGRLPFAGRGAEVTKLLTFCRAALQAEQLRACLIIGEAGSGKSRLLEESMPQIAADGRVVIHTKIYPESAVTLPALIARDLQQTQSMGWLRLGPWADVLYAQPTLGNLTDTLRRLSHLRPTILILEDIHLLGQTPLRDFAALLQALADEALSMIFLSRPTENPARDVVEQFLVERLELGKLNDDDLAVVWAELFGTRPHAQALNALHQATGGNALALRAALRGAVSAGTITQRGGAGRTPGWEVAVDGRQFQQGLQRSVSRVIEGMAAHLSPDERLACERLATLGEVFSREAAQRMMPDADQTIATLLVKGMLVTVERATMLIAGPASASLPLAFTHTIVHRQLTDRAVADIPGLVDLASGHVPVYSVRPFILIADHPGTADIDVDTGRRFLDMCEGHLFSMLDQSSYWQLALKTWDAASNVLKWIGPALEAGQREYLELRLVAKKCILSIRLLTQDDEFTANINLLLQRTASPQTSQMAGLHCFALAMNNFVCPAGPLLVTMLEQSWPVAEQLIEQFPDLMHDENYGRYLLIFRSKAGTTSLGSEFVPQMKHRVTELHRIGVRSPWLSTIMMPAMFKYFETAEECQEFTELSQDDFGFMGNIFKMEFYSESGQYDKTLSVAAPLLELARAQGRNESIFLTEYLTISAQAATGMPPAMLRERLKDLYTFAQESLTEEHTQFVELLTVETGYLCDLLPDLTASITLHESTDDHPQIEAMLSVLKGDVEKAVTHCQLLEITFKRTWLTTRFLRESPNDTTPDTALLTEIIAEFSKSVNKNALMQDLLLAADLAHASGLIQRHPALRTAIVDACNAALEWVAMRRLHPYMLTLINRPWNGLSNVQKKEWTDRAREIERERAQALHGDHLDSVEAGIRLFVAGTIAFQPTGQQDPTPIRGARLRALTGILVADQMAPRPIPEDEFLRIATVDTEDSAALDRRAMRNNLRVSVHRLREALGHDAILTEGNRPHLNTAHVWVDALEAQRALNAASADARAGHLARAVPGLRLALGLLGNHIMFPSLYDRYFEALRDEFESRLRRTVLIVSEGLTGQGAVTDAEELLEDALKAIPGDEEFADLLKNIYTQQGKMSEAELVRIRAQIDEAE